MLMYIRRGIQQSAYTSLELEHGLLYPAEGL